ncbi:MAG: hypothetical protein BroJett011_57430 [Chloroflexota bacterium]|nr:MAG: hypothetical protein BroJett011_57430 [Chloroflexota bacterium]
MKSLFELSRDLWVEAQLRAPDWAQRSVIPYLHGAKELMRLRPYLTIYRLSGHNQGGPLTVDYVGLDYLSGLLDNPFTDYRPTLVRNLFAEAPTIKEIGRVALWQAGTLTNLPGNDLVIVLGSQYLIRSLPRQNAIVQPFFVRMLLNVRGDWDDVKRRFHKNVRDYQLRLVRKYGYEYEVSPREEDFEMFYHQMYSPTMAQRHHELASPMSVEEARQNFQRGFLHLIKRDGQYVAGGLSYPQGRIIRFRLIGVVNADEQLMREGALGAYYYAITHWANQEGYDYVSFGDSAPHLADGILQHKRRWGAAATCSDTSQQRIWLKVKRDTPAVRQFFKDNPLIIIGERGQLQGLIVTDEPDKVTEATRQDWEKQYATSGLEKLLICSVADFFDGNPGIKKTKISKLTFEGVSHE